MGSASRYVLIAINILLLFLWVSTLSAQPSAQTTALSLDQVIDETLSRNLRLMADRYDIAVAEARILQARLRPNPILNVQTGYLDVLGAGFDYSKNPAGPPEFDMGVNFWLEQRGKRDARIKLASAVKSVTEMDFLNRTRLLILDAQGAFVELQAAKENVILLQSTTKAFETIVELNTVRVRSGDLAGVELTRSEVAALQYQNQVRSAQARVRLAQNRLQSLMGRSTFEASFDISGALRGEDVTFDVQQLRTRALQMRPDLLAIRRDLLRADADAHYQRKLTVGDTGLQVLANKQWDIGIVRGRSVSVNLLQPLPFLNRNQGEIQRADQERLQVRARIRAAEADILAEVQNAFVQYTAARQVLESIRTGMLDRAQRVRETMEYSYRRGEASFVEFLDAQRVFNETMQSYNDARAEYARSLFLLDSVTGLSTQKP